MNKLRTFHPGQIRPECSGPRIIVINAPRGTNSYGAFDVHWEPTNQQNDLRALTGTLAVNVPPVRIYYGVSVDKSKELARSAREVGKEGMTLIDLDKIVVHSYFLDRELDGSPYRIHEEAQV